MPKPPMRPAHKSLRMSPYRLGITSTSNLLGSCTIYGPEISQCFGGDSQSNLTFKQTVSKYISLYLISGCCSATSRQQCKNKPSDIRLYNVLLVILNEANVHLHDVGLVNSCDCLPSICLCVLERIFRYSTTSWLCDQFDTLHYTGNNLKEMIGEKSHKQL